MYQSKRKKGLFLSLMLIIQDFTPAGTPQFNPVEPMFGYIGKYLEDKSSIYNTIL
jgi:hypothetical protein